MPTKNVVASFILGLLFISLVILYLSIPQNNLVTFLSILILLVSLLVGLTGGWREIGVMAAFAGLVSIVAAHFVGLARFGAIGGWLVPIVWVLILLGMFNWISNTMLRVPKDRAVLIVRPYSGFLYQAASPVAPPLMPYFERKIAEIPLYELSQDVEVKDVNTKRFNVQAIHVHIHYRVADPKRAMGGIPNRGQVQGEIAGEMKLDLSKARQEITFWERLLGKQMSLEVDDIVREVVYNNVFAQNPLEVYQNREDLAGEVQDRLGKLVSRWGVEIVDLEFDRIDNDIEVLKRLTKANARIDATEEKELDAKREATRIRLTGEAQAEAEARRVTELVRALQESGVKLSADELREIVIDAIRASNEWGMEAEMMRLGAPSGDKK